MEYDTSLERNDRSPIPTASVTQAAAIHPGGRNTAEHVKAVLPDPDKHLAERPNIDAIFRHTDVRPHLGACKTRRVVVRPSDLPAKVEASREERATVCSGDWNDNAGADIAAVVEESGGWKRGRGSRSGAGAFRRSEASKTFLSLVCGHTEG